MISFISGVCSPSVELKVRMTGLSDFSCLEGRAGRSDLVSAAGDESGEDVMDAGELRVEFASA
ncbi:hypothetical protein [Luteolibacter ambystomatis]|uniref:hypothetical protein n=1 Tax=Luteolibacter ambystomatis TaxID=2824561 RepID=UPI0036DD8AAA